MYLTQVSTSAGALVAYLLGGLAWQLQAAGCALASMPVLALHAYAIENPRWLQMRGRPLDADTAVMRLYGVDPPPDFRPQRPVAAPAEPAQLRWPRQARMVVACLLLHLLQNLSCAQFLLLRAVQVLGTAVADMPAQAVAAFVVALHVGFTAMVAAVTNIARRHRLLGASSSLVAGVLFIFRPLEYMGFGEWSVDEQPSVTSWGALLSVTSLMLAYSVGLCHLPTLLTGELLPSRLRHPASSFIWASRWLVAFVLLHFEVDVLSSLSQRASLLALSMMVLLVAATVVLLVPDTEGRTLGDIESG
ncbi:solute carrier family 2, facilitated glucose transporter member 6-like [Amblyomma americanum]